MSLTIVGGNPAETGPTRTVVELLEELLEEAKTGKIHAIGIAMVLDNGRCRPGWASAKGQSFEKMLGAIDYLHRFVMKCSDEQDS